MRFLLLARKWADTGFSPLAAGPLFATAQGRNHSFQGLLPGARGLFGGNPPRYLPQTVPGDMARSAGPRA